MTRHVAPAPAGADLGFSTPKEALPILAEVRSADRRDGGTEIDRLYGLQIAP